MYRRDQQARYGETQWTPLAQDDRAEKPRVRGERGFSSRWKSDCTWPTNFHRATGFAFAIPSFNSACCVIRFGRSYLQAKTVAIPSSSAVALANSTAAKNASSLSGLPPAIVIVSPRVCRALPFS